MRCNCVCNSTISSIIVITATICCVFREGSAGWRVRPCSKRKLLHQRRIVRIRSSGSHLQIRVTPCFRRSKRNFSWGAQVRAPDKYELVFKIRKNVVNRAEKQVSYANRIRPSFILGEVCVGVRGGIGRIHCFALSSQSMCRATSGRLLWPPFKLRSLDTERKIS